MPAYPRHPVAQNWEADPLAALVPFADVAVAESFGLFPDTIFPKEWGTEDRVGQSTKTALFADLFDKPSAPVLGMEVVPGGSRVSSDNFGSIFVISATQGAEGLALNALLGSAAAFQRDSDLELSDPNGNGTSNNGSLTAGPCGWSAYGTEGSVTGNTVLMGVAGRDRWGMPQDIGRHGASRCLTPAAQYTITLNYDLRTWDAYNDSATGGRGYWDSFSVSVTAVPFPQLPGLIDPLSFPGLGFLWGGTQAGTRTLEAHTGTTTFTVSGNPNGDNYLNVVLDTETLDDTQVPANELYPSWGTITANVAPVANDDEFAVGMDETLNVPAPGVLYNDISYGGPLTAELVSPTTNGSVSLNSVGSFTYTPITGFSGSDSFTYNASDAGLLSAQPATVRIVVVQIDLQMAGVGVGEKLNPGGFVPINANNDNGSVVTGEIPATRDFNVNPLPAGVNDFDLKQVNVAITPAIPLLGFFILAVNNTGTGRIRLWNDRNKGAEVTPGTYEFPTLPRQFFVEGTEPSAALRESNLTLSYFFIDPLLGVVGAGSDRVNVTVTPVLNSFAVTPSTDRSIDFVDQVLRTGLQGLIAANLRSDPQQRGANFSAQVNKKGDPGLPFFVLNLTNVSNGLFTQQPPPNPNGFIFVAGSGLTNQKWCPRAGERFPFLDTENGDPAPPRYNTNFSMTSDGDLRTITATDSPRSFVPGSSDKLAIIDLAYSFRLYLVWRHPDATLYTLATVDWEVGFWADTNVATQGVTVIRRLNGVAARPYARNHENPKTTGTWANAGMFITALDACP